MKKILVLGIAALLGSCSNSPKETTVTESKEDTLQSTPAPPPPVDLPYKASYSSDWSIGDPKYTKIVLDFYKALEADNIAGSIDYFEDSVQFSTYDNRTIKRSKEEMFKLVKDFRKRFKSLNQEFYAFVTLHSNDRNEDWVGLWIKERGIRLNGKPDSTNYQENWRFRNGKVYSLGDYARYGERK
jgi:hypothetical protein